MTIDTSAVLAILQQEPEVERFARAIALVESRLISAANLLEAAMRVRAGYGPEGERDLDFLLLTLKIEAVPVTPGQVAIVRTGFSPRWQRVPPGGAQFG